MQAALIFKAIVQIILFIVAERAQIKAAVKGIQTLLPDADGTTKAAQLNAFIGHALGVTDQIERVAEVVQPLINPIVAEAKVELKALAAPAG